MGPGGPLTVVSCGSGRPWLFGSDSTHAQGPRAPAWALWLRVCPPGRGGLGRGALGFSDPCSCPRSLRCLEAGLRPRAPCDGAGTLVGWGWGLPETSAGATCHVPFRWVKVGARIQAIASPAFDRGAQVSLSVEPAVLLLLQANQTFLPGAQMPQFCWWDFLEVAVAARFCWEAVCSLPRSPAFLLWAGGALAGGPGGSRAPGLPGASASTGFRRPVSGFTHFSLI